MSRKSCGARQFGYCWALLVPLAATNVCGSEGSLKNRFLSEAPPAWEAYQRTELRIEGSFVETVTNLRKNQVVRKSSRDIRVVGPWAVFTDWPEVMPLRQQVGGDVEERQEPLAQSYGLNSRYAFQLAQGATKNDWVIEKLQPVEEAAQGDRGIAWYAMRGASPLSDALALYPLDFTKIVGNNGFVVNDAREVQRGLDSLIEVTFSYLPTEGRAARKDVRIPKGIVVLDPRRYWLIREADVETIWPRGELGTVSIRNSFDDSIAGIPLITEYTAHVRADAARPMADEDGMTESVDQLRKYEYSLRRIDSPSERDFTLTAFGLPEPYQPENAWLWWILGIGLALIAGAYLWRRAAAR
jgi:hypothetical protein